MLLIASASENFHADHIANFWFKFQKSINFIASAGVRVAQVLDPRGCIDQRHHVRGVRIAARSPSHPVPRIALASSRVIGSIAKVRNAKLTASFIVVKLKRSITRRHASSSMSMFVLAMLIGYTPFIHLTNCLPVGCEVCNLLSMCTCEMNSEMVDELIKFTQ
jgi:hypothetical protein